MSRDTFNISVSNEFCIVACDNTRGLKITDIRAVNGISEFGLSSDNKSKNNFVRGLKIGNRNF